MKYDVICVGSALLDVYMKSEKFVKISSGMFADGVALCEEFGGKTEVAQVEVCSGGGGSNNAVSFARKGFKSALISEMGTDLVAATIKEELRRENVALDFLVEEDDEETGISSILVSPDGGRAVNVFRGASKMLHTNDIRWNEIEADWLHISSLGGEVDLLKALIEFAFDKGIKVAVNPGGGEIEVLKQWGDKGKSLWEKVEVLLMNREEAEALSEQNFGDEAVWQSEVGIEGPKYCVLTDGKNGGKVVYEERSQFYAPKLVEAVEETGAGDAFGSGFVAALMKGREVGEAIEWAKSQAASVVQYMGAKKGLLRLEDLM